MYRMLEVGFVTKEQYDQAVAEKLEYYVKKDSILAPHFVFYIKELLTEKYGMKKVTEGGLQITTTLDLDMQDFVQTSVATEVAKLKRYNVTNGAALVTEPKTGQILAMIGSKDYFSDDIDGKYNVTTALRQPGSSIKPLNYAVALETGKLTAGSVLFDGPNCFSVEGQKPYCPTNYGNKFFGMQSVRNSLANSLNIAAVKTGPGGSFVAMNGEITAVPTQKIIPVDTTGAGDLYAAGFLYALSKGKSAFECGRTGSVIASEVITTIGAKIPEEKWSSLVQLTK
ncbi:MAG: hypothetical protein EOM23_05090 [Candidatus Moranbacteria bacterium]|nr:hypothetical protein [Candidatus Moranbacteria bacterium]